MSDKTVSRVLNGAPHVSDDIQRRVRAAADMLAYHPNVFARSLVRGHSHLIGLVFEKPSAGYIVELQTGVLDALEAGEYRLIIVPVTSVRDHAPDIVGLLRAAALDGVVLAPPAADDPLILDQLTESDIRFARIAPTKQLDRGSSAMIDDTAGAYAIAAHVLAAGHRDIGIVKGDPSHAATEARLTGYRQAFRDAGCPIRTDRIEIGMFTFDGGVAAGHRLLDQVDRPTAILAQNDEMAVGVMAAARTLGLPLPDQVSIVGFDDAEVSRIVWPRLTTVRQPVFDMAVSATRMLVADLRGEDSPRRSDHRNELLIRESVAPPPHVRMPIRRLPDSQNRPA